MADSAIRGYHVERKYNVVPWREIVGKKGVLAYKAYLHPVPTELCSTQLHTDKLVSPIAKVTKTLSEEYGICACTTQKEAEEYALNMKRDLKIMEVFLVLCTDYLKDDDKYGKCYRYVTPLRRMSTYPEIIKNSGDIPGYVNKIGVVPLFIVHRESVTGPFVIFDSKIGLVTCAHEAPNMFAIERDRYRIEYLDDDKNTMMIYNAEKPK